MTKQMGTDIIRDIDKKNGPLFSDERSVCIQIPEIQQEVDVPPKIVSNPDIKMSPQETDRYEREYRRKQKENRLKMWGFSKHTLIACLVVLIIIAFVDQFLLSLVEGHQTSSMLSSLFEFFKITASTLVGILFSTKILLGDEKDS